MLQHQSTGQSLEGGSLCLFHPIPSCSLPSWGRDAGITEHAVPAGLGFLEWSFYPQDPIESWGTGAIILERNTDCATSACAINWL